VNKPSLKIIFAGTPDFAALHLEALQKANYSIVAVYTQPDRPKGRGQHILKSPVKILAEKYAIPVYQPTTLRDVEEQEKFKNLSADLMVVVAYGLLLPLPILKAPRLGCINVHASLLPRFRGAAPIQRAILAGDNITGVTLMQMDEGLDTGDILYQASCPITSCDTSETLHQRLGELGAKTLVKELPHLETLTKIPQDEALATYAHKLKKEEAALNWTLSAEVLDRQVRAFQPWPVASTTISGEVIRIWEASVRAEKNVKSPGTLIRATKEGIDVATGAGVLSLQKIQLPNGRVLAVKDILNAHQHLFSEGKMMGAP